MAHPVGGRARGAALSGPPVVVFDTNAWLDLLVFDDPALRGADAWIRATRLVAAVDARTIAEFDRVLAYPALSLDTDAQGAHRAAARDLATCIDVPPLALPRCSDPDDQVFLEVAVAGGASWLVTRDAALLRMARRMARDYGVAILPPAVWREAVDAQMSKR